jgi:hypothetical protein
MISRSDRFTSREGAAGTNLMEASLNPRVYLDLLSKKDLPLPEIKRRPRGS